LKFDSAYIKNKILTCQNQIIIGT